MNYRIITDETLLKDFINWLPELEDNQIYYLCLFARNKYCKEVKHISSDKAQLKRFTSNKEKMFNKIKQLEVEIGQYYQFRNNEKVIIPQEALALYITVNPRDMFKATYGSIKKLLTLIENKSTNFNPHQEILSEIQRTRAKHSIHNWVDFDIDAKDVDLSTLNNIVPNQCYKILESRGGYHLLVDSKHVDLPKTNWYKQIQEQFNIDQVGDNMIPVIGTYQGGFTPKFITI